MRKAVFFDRDGVLNVDKSYLGFIKDFEWMDGAKEALAYLTRQGYAIIVVTNQSGVARGYYTEDDVKVLHDWMCQEAAKLAASLRPSITARISKGRRSRRMIRRATGASRHRAWSCRRQKITISI